MEASILTCSAAFDWFCNNFYKEVQGDIYQKIDQEIAQSPPGANGCMLLPFFREGNTTVESKSNCIIYKCNIEYDKRRYGESFAGRDRL